VLPGSDYLPLFSGFGVGAVAPPAGGVLDDELVPGELLDDEELDGGVLGVLEELDDDDGALGVAGLIVDDEDDPDGDGVTTGGVFGEVDVVDDSRLQPATPNTRPVHSSVTSALFIAISRRLRMGCPPRI
jgi:hypothetical protein